MVATGPFFHVCLLPSLGMSSANLILIILAAFIATRVTRLVTADRVFQPLRDRIITKFGMGHPLTYWVHCPWCVGVWVSLAASVVVVFTAPDGWLVSAWWLVPGLAAAYSWLCGLTERFVDDGEEN